MFATMLLWDYDKYATCSVLDRLWRFSAIHSTAQSRLQANQQQTQFFMVLRRTIISSTRPVWAGVGNNEASHRVANECNIEQVMALVFGGVTHSLRVHSLRAAVGRVHSPPAANRPRHVLWFLITDVYSGRSVVYPIVSAFRSIDSRAR